MSDLMNTVLSGIMPNNRERLFYLQEHVEPDFFTGPYRDLWTIIDRISVMTGGEVATRDAVGKVMDRTLDLPLERRAAIEEAFNDLKTSSEVSDVDFKSSVELLGEDYQKNKLGEGMANAMEVLTKGVRKGNDLIYGVNPAIESLHQSISEIERVSHGMMPEGNIFDERVQLLRSLEEQGTMNRQPTLIKPLDDLTLGGFGLGELWLIAAYAGVGKTFFCANMAYTMGMLQGLNVVFLTAETLRSQVRNRILVRHSHHEKFGLSNGLSSSLLKKHTPSNPTLTPDQVEIWKNVIMDFTEPSPDKGIIHVAQIPLGAKISTIGAKLNKLQNSFDVDVVIIDSLDLLTPEVRRNSTREELNNILADAKHLATTFNNGAGVRLVSPWQTSRDAWRKAKEEGRYDKSSMAETSEAERKADLILALLEHPTDSFRLRAQTLKFRDSTPKDFDLRIDYDRCYVGSEKSADDAFNESLISGLGADGLFG